MPWEHCEARLDDGTMACPTCGSVKAGWTVRLAKTRQFVLGRTFIHAELQDGEGEPVPGQPYRVKLPGGATREGELDRHGVVHLETHRRGAGTIEFLPRAHWIEVAAVEPDGSPARGRPYRVVLPDGSVREGTLDGAGAARIASPIGGQARVSFPVPAAGAAPAAARSEEPAESAAPAEVGAPTEAPAAEPQAAEPEGQAPEAAPKSEPEWVELELLDESGRPAASRPYRLRLPDGTTQAGRLDSSGRARVASTVAGAGGVSFD